jgi:hypothetical protein
MNRLLAGFGFVLASAIPALGGVIGPVNAADLTFWSYPDPPQDFDNLPSSPDGVPLNVSAFYQYGAAPIDQTFSGTAPLGMIGNQANEYSIRVLADASPAAVRAAFQTTYNQFQGSNISPPFYLDGDQVRQGDQPQIGALDAYMQDSVTVHGPGLGGFTLTLVVHFDGSNSSTWLDYGGPGGPNPATVGAVFVDILPGGGEAINFRDNGTYDQFIQATSTALLDSPSLFVYGFAFSQYSSRWGDLQQAQSTFLTGTIDYDFSATARLEKVLITLPSGSDPRQYTAEFGSGAIYNVEFVVSAAAVPEPKSATLLGLGAAMLTVMGWSRRLGSN